MSKIVVTGANGFVGKHLLKELKENNYEIIAIGGSQAEPLVDERDIEYMTLDLNSLSETKKIDFTGVSGVIHLAGLAAVGPSFKNPMQYIDINIGLEVNLFEAALSQNSKPKFLAISSGTLYNPQTSQPLTETSPLLPNSPYAVSKIGQEQMANYYTTRGFESIIARPFNHIGPGQGQGFIVPDFAKQLIAIRNGEQSEIMVGNLDAKRDYTDVRDIVRAYRLILEQGKTGEVYNICSGKPVSGEQILKGLSKAADVNPTVIQDSNKIRPSDSPLICGDFSKLTNDTGWQPMISLEETLSDVIAEFC